MIRAFRQAVAAALDRAIAVQRVEALGPFPGYLADACARQAEQTEGSDSAAWYRRAWWLLERKTRYLELQLGLRTAGEGTAWLCAAVIRMTSWSERRSISGGSAGRATGRKRA